jgi:hypothetical protein
MLGKNEEKGKGNKKSCVSQTSAAIKKGRLKILPSYHLKN